jgi:nucleotidyltransferase substrate binding protein (TIGR01987 family)
LSSLSALEQEGSIQRFEFVLELAWKTLKDYLEHEGRTIQPTTPRSVIKEAFAAGFLPDGQVCIDMIDHRNLLSHTYNSQLFGQALEAVRDRYLGAFEQLHEWLLLRSIRPTTPS